MPSTPPRPSQPPAKSSGGPYIVAIVVVSALIMALLWFKMRTPEPPAPTPVYQSVQVAPTNAPAPDFDIPPPPPIEAGTDAEKPKGTGAAPIGPGGCAGPCSGDAPPALRSALTGAGASSRGCYERALRTNSMLAGKLVASVRVAPNGSICSASIAQDSLHSAEVTACVLGQLRGGKFPAPTGGSCVDVNIPLSFTPQEKK